MSDYKDSEEEMDRILWLFNGLYMTGKFSEADAILRDLDVEAVPSITLLVTYMVVANLAKDKLPSRSGLIQRIEVRLKREVPERWERLMRNLRG